MTTLAVRAREQAIERRFASSPTPRAATWGRAPARSPSDRSPSGSAGRSATSRPTRLEVITGPERGAILVGPAGTGKGVVIDAAARAEQLTGRRDAWGSRYRARPRSASASDSPALAGQTMTLDALVARVQRGQRRASTSARRSTSTRPGWPTPSASSGSPSGRSAPGQSSSRSATPRNSPRSAPAACSTGSPRSRRAPSSRTSTARSTRPSSARGRTCAPDARIRRWLTTSPRAPAHRRHPR